jgi:hypothetical protein
LFYVEVLYSTTTGCLGPHGLCNIDCLRTQRLTGDIQGEVEDRLLTAVSENTLFSTWVACSQ